MQEPANSSAREPGFVSVATRLAFLIFALLTGVSIVVAFELTEREREHFVASKERAARMLTELFALSVAPALDFADADAVSASLGMLVQNQEVVDAAVWAADGEPPIARLRQLGAPLGSRERTTGTRVAEDHIDIAVVVKSPVGKPLGTAWVRVSLAQENAAFVGARRHIFAFSLVFSALVAGMLVTLVRRTIVSPLSRLERAAGRLGAGELIELGDLRSDEIGSLGRTFNRMGRAIREREECISAVNARLQGLLDNMRQAIVVFDCQGRLKAERSRTAREVFGTTGGEGSSIVDLLYPSGQASEVEREAFVAWLAEVQRTSAEGFEELAELSPKEVELVHAHGGAVERLLELEFRRSADENGQPRIMLLATDVTAQRNLERSVQTREREHQGQLAAMRRLVAGGGQVLVRFLASARKRLAECERDLAQSSVLTPVLIEDVFRFVHTLRAEARAFDLERVERVVLGLETELAGARHLPADSPFGRTIHQSMRRGCLDIGRELDAAEEVLVASSPIGRRVLEQVTVSRQDVEELHRRLGARKDELGRLASRLASRPFGEITSTLPDNVQGWAKKEGKLVEVVVDGREVLVPPPLCEHLHAVLTHLLRNAVAHGIETPTYRRERGKAEIGRIAVACTEAPHGVAVSVSDDGRGFDFDTLRRRAGPTASALEDAELAFAPGISTRDRPDELAGRGVGLGAVREELRRAGYLVNIIANRGTGVTARIEPLPQEDKDEPWRTNTSL